MTAQIEFFCSQREEKTILQYLIPDSGITVFLLDGKRIKELPDFTTDQLPEWPEFTCLYLWNKSLGPLQWHNQRPQLTGATHRSFISRFFAREHWDRSGMVQGDSLLDQDLSPGICYKRPELDNGRIGPCTLLAPPSNLERVSAEYARWVNRYISWIRRRGTKVHDWRSPSTVIPNPHSFLNSIYAFPDALKEIESGEHRFIITGVQQ